MHNYKNLVGFRAKKRKKIRNKKNFSFAKSSVILHIPNDDRKSVAAGKDVPMKLSEARKVLEALQKEIAAEMRYDEQQSLLYGLIWKQRVQAIQTVLKLTENLPDEE